MPIAAEDFRTSGRALRRGENLGVRGAEGGGAGGLLLSVPWRLLGRPADALALTLYIACHGVTHGLLNRFVQVLKRNDRLILVLGCECLPY